VNTLLYHQLRGYASYIRALGGIEVTRAHQGDALTPLNVLSAERQREALRFVLEAFSPEILQGFPKHFLDKMPRERWADWTSSWSFGLRFHFPIHDSVTAMRAEVIASAFHPERLLRIRDNAYRSDEIDPYTLDEHFMGFTETIWADVRQGETPSDSFQRAIQSLHLDLLIALAADQSPNRVSDAVAMAYAELVRLNEAIAKRLARGELDVLTQAHLMEAQHRLLKALSTDH
jgi:hypothetical protein